MSGIPWDELNKSAEDAVADIIELLAEGYTGEMTLHCKDGGVGALNLSGGNYLLAQLREARRIKRALTDAPDSD